MHFAFHLRTNPKSLPIARVKQSGPEGAERRIERKAGRCERGAVFEDDYVAVEREAGSNRSGDVAKAIETLRNA